MQAVEVATAAVALEELNALLTVEVELPHKAEVLVLRVVHHNLNIAEFDMKYLWFLKNTNYLLDM